MYVLSYGWRMGGMPDPGNASFAFCIRRTVRKLISGLLCARIIGSVGKSSLQQRRRPARCFALFGEASKSEQDRTSLRSDHAAADLSTEVEFVFDVGERRFVVVRQPDQMRPKQRGEGETKSAHEAYLFDATGLSLDEITGETRGKIIAEKKVRDVDAAVSKLRARPHAGAT